MSAEDAVKPFRALFFALAIAIPAVIPVSAGAIDVQNFKPGIGTENLVMLYEANGLKQGQFGASLTGNYAASPLLFTFPDNSDLRVIDTQVTGEFAAFAGAFDWWTIGVAASSVWVAGRDLDAPLNPDFPESEFEADSGFGDVRAMMKFTILRNKPDSVGLAIVPLVTFPTGKADVYAGSEAVNAGGRLVVSKRWDRVNIVLNGGYLAMGDADGADEGFDPAGQAQFGAGVSVRLHRAVDVMGEIYGHTVDYGIEELEAEVPAEALLAGKFYAGPMVFTAGGAAGINSGMGNPTGRAFLAVAFTYPKLDRRLPKEGGVAGIPLDSPDHDTDKDGLTNYAESKKTMTNPLDPDTDGDGLKDGEEVNTTKTDPLQKDTDRDALYDFEEVKVHGTDPLNKDTDGDTLVDGVEVKQFKTSPTSVDTDEDRVPDNLDGAPLELETDNDIMDWDGVPEIVLAKKPSGVVLTDAFVWVPASFAWTGDDKDRLGAGDEAYIRDIAGVMTDYPKIKVEVQGHVSFGGNPQFNQWLSTRRAQVVREAIIGAGVSPDRVIFRGYGADFPVSAPDSDLGKKMNDRIEIVITEQ